MFPGQWQLMLYFGVFHCIGAITVIPYFNDVTGFFNQICEIFHNYIYLNVSNKELDMFDQNCDFTKNFSNIYTLKVTLIEGPITNSFAQKNPDISRTVKILGNQTLRDLHSAIFRAFDRTDEQLYEFQFETCPHEAGHTCYVLPTEMKDAFGTTILAGDVTQVTIDSLHLSVNECFGYWFDFGYDWLHTVRVQAIELKVPQDDYPITVDRIGKAPPSIPTGTM